MTDVRVHIIDNGICNLFNVRRAFEFLGAGVVTTCSQKEILGASHVVLPGVGAFGSGIESLKNSSLFDTIHAYAKSGKPLLGICLGMQLLFSASEEHGVWEGLSLIEGRVRRFQEPEKNGTVYKIPQIGWNHLERERPWEKTVLRGLEEKPYFYFVHSYVVEPSNPDLILATTSYGKDRFCSVLKKENISACQFHPERSGKTGLNILKNFLREE